MLDKTTEFSVSLLLPKTTVPAHYLGVQPPRTHASQLRFRENAQRVIHNQFVKARATLEDAGETRDTLLGQRHEAREQKDWNAMDEAEVGLIRTDDIIDQIAGNLSCFEYALKTDRGHHFETQDERARIEILIANREIQALVARHREDTASSSASDCDDYYDGSLYGDSDVE